MLNATAMHMETFRNSRAVRNAGSVLLPFPVSDIFLPAVCPQERGQVRIWSYTMTSQVPNAFYRAQSRPRLRLAMTRAWRPKRWTRRDRTWQGAASAQTRRQRKKSSRGGECGATSFCIRLNSFRYTATIAGQATSRSRICTNVCFCGTHLLPPRLLRQPLTSYEAPLFAPSAGWRRTVSIAPITSR